MVLCHGGSGTTYGALAAGLPIVFVPMFADQRTNAQLISVAGAGVSLTSARSPSRVSRHRWDGRPAHPRGRHRILAKSSYALAAQVIAEEISSTGSARDCLEELFAR